MDKSKNMSELDDDGRIDFEIGISFVDLLPIVVYVERANQRVVL